MLYYVVYFMCVAGNSGCRGQPAVPDGGEFVAPFLD